MKTIESRILSQADLFRVMGRKVTEDCVREGWIKPRVDIPNGQTKRLKLFALEDMRRCEERILNGEYPTKQK